MGCSAARRRTPDNRTHRNKGVWQSMRAQCGMVRLTSTRTAHHLGIRLVRPPLVTSRALVWPHRVRPPSHPFGLLPPPSQPQSTHSPIASATLSNLQQRAWIGKWSERAKYLLFARQCKSWARSHQAASGQTLHGCAARECRTHAQRVCHRDERDKNKRR